MNNNCIKCGKYLKIYARNMCNPCYQRWLYSKKDKTESFYKKKRELGKCYYKENREKVLGRQKKWRRKNPELAKERVKLSTRKRRARFKVLGEFDDVYLFGGNKKAVYERDGYRCRDCGMSNAEHLKEHRMCLCVHHIDGSGAKKLVNEKNNSADNLVTLCIACHRREHARMSQNKGRKLLSEF